MADEFAYDHEKVTICRNSEGASLGRLIASSGALSMFPLPEIPS